MALETGHNRVLRVMLKYGIKPPRRKLRGYYTTRSTNHHSYTNLIKQLAISKPNQIWASDLTYIKYQGKFLYLATVKELFTRKILSARIGIQHNAELALTAIKSAVFNSKTNPEFFHSDQGSEYMAGICTGYLESIGTKVSVSDKGSPWQNPYQESFFDKFKTEVGDLTRFETVGELAEEIYSYVHYYNNFRIHTALKMPPQKFSELCLKNSGT